MTSLLLSFDNETLLKHDLLLKSIFKGKKFSLKGAISFLQDSTPMWMRDKKNENSSVACS